MVLMSTPARERCVAVVWRMVWGPIRFLRISGTRSMAACAWRVTISWMPKRVSGSVATIEEHWSVAAPPGDKVSQCHGRGGPERTDANFAALAVRHTETRRHRPAAMQAEIIDA